MSITTDTRYIRGPGRGCKVHEVVDELSLRRLAANTPMSNQPPKGDRAAFFAPKTNWIPRNEAVALALGKAQIAARLLDDQGISVLHVNVCGDTAAMSIDRAPAQGSIHGEHTKRVGTRSYGRALLGEGEHAVLVEWAL